MEGQNFELDYGVIPTSGTGVIRITGTDFANDKEHMAVEFFGKFVKLVHNSQLREH